MSTWVIPYVDQDLDFWYELEELYGPHIKEVYAPLPRDRFASGRSRQPNQYLERFLSQGPFHKSVLLNPVVLDRPVEDVAPDALALLKNVRDAYGVQRVTVANPALARRIKEALPEFSVIASVLMGIASPLQVVMVGEHVDAIAPDTRLVRDLGGLQRLRAAFDGEIRLLVNEACLPGCVFRTQHFYEMGYGQGYPLSLCEQMLDKEPWLRLTGAWILPQHVHLYDTLYDSLKLAGRVTLFERHKYLAVLGAYIRRTPLSPVEIGGGPASPLQDIPVTEDWFRTVVQCDKRCDCCSVCREYHEHTGRKQEEKAG